ncbi:MAG: kelch repeat-containing protein [Elusimicrobiales bacterium]|nr:kelch repeat-containing protein [Elusimicrobiales bacterium]
MHKMRKRIALISRCFIFAAGAVAALCAGAHAAALMTPRYNHTMTLLPNGDLLIAGGNMANDAEFTGSIQVFSSNDYQYYSAATMGVARSSHTATLLSNGLVLIAGGTNGSGALNSAYVFNPNTYALPATGAMTGARSSHTATLLSNGKVLLAGGDATGTYEIFNPASNTFAAGPAMLTPSSRHTATRLPDGRVLIAGGYNGTTYLNRTEIYNPATGGVSPGPVLSRARASHTATVMSDGTVLIAGGYNANNSYNNTYGYVDTVERYNPAANIMDPSAADMPARLAFHTSTLYPDGSAVIYGGLGNVTTQYFASPNYVIDTSTITLVPRTGSYVVADIVSAGTTVQLLTDRSFAARPVSGVIVSGDLLISSPAVNTHHIVNTDVNLDFKDAVGSLDNHPVYKGFMQGATKLRYPAGGAPMGAAVFTRQDLTSDVTAGTCNITFASSGKINPGNTCVLAFTKVVPFPATDALPGSLLLRAQISQLKGTLTDGTTSMTLTSGDASSTAVNSAITWDLINDQGYTTFTFTVTNLVGDVTPKATASPHDFSPGEGTAFTMKADYIVSPITTAAQTTFTTPAATATIRTMIFSDYLSYQPSANSWTINPFPNAAHPAQLEVDVYGTANHATVLTQSGTPFSTGGRRCAFTPGEPSVYDCSISSGTASYANNTRFAAFEKIVSTPTSPTSMNVARYGHAATLLPDGRILVTGGSDGASQLDTAEYYSSTAATWYYAGSKMAAARANHTATLMANGNVLVAGGYFASSGSLATSEVFYPKTNTFAATGSMSVPRQKHTAIILPSGGSAGNIMVIGGKSNDDYENTCEVYISTMAAWKTIGPVMNARRAFHTATILQDGRVLVAGGVNATNNALNSAEIYNPAANTWTAVASMNTARYYHTATLLRSGRVLVVGGSGGFGEIFSAEQYDPVSNAWTQLTIPPLLDAGGAAVPVDRPRLKHTATLLPNGDVLLAGGFSTNDNQAKKYLDYFPSDTGGLYSTLDPETAVSSLGTRRGDHTATLMGDGTVIFAGGYDGSKPVSNTEQVYFMAPVDSVNAGALNRKPSKVTLDTKTFDHQATVTLQSGASNFYGITEAAGGGANQGSHDNPRVVLHMMDTLGGYMRDLSTGVYAGPVANSWSKIASSITLTTPYLPYGWYQFRAADNAVFSDGVPVFVGAPAPSGLPAAPSATVLGVSTISWTWGQGTVASADGYSAYDAASGLFLSTVAFANPAGLVTSTTTANAPLSISVGPYNISGEGSFIQSPTYYTFAAAPTSMTLSSITFNQARLNWSPNGNSGLTPYEINVSLTGSMTPTHGTTPDEIAFEVSASTPIPFSQLHTSTAATLTNLVPGITYYLRVSARNGAGVVTGFCCEDPSNPGVYFSTRTVGSPQNITGTPSSISAIRWAWEQVGGADSFSIFNSSMVLIATMTATATPFFDYTGLATNTPYSIFIQASTHTASGIVYGNQVPSPTVYTLADTPQSAWVYSIPSVSVTTSTMTGFWSPNSNPGGTVYTLEVSTSDFKAILETVIVIQPPLGANYVSGTTTPDLTPNTKYGMRVTAQNGDGLKTVSVLLTSGTYTLAQTPLVSSFLADQVTASSLRLTWSASSNPSNTPYNIQMSSTGAPGSFSDAVPFSSNLTQSTYTITTGLLSATSYWFMVRARNGDNTDTSAISLANVGGYVLTLGGPGGTLAHSIVGLAGSGVISGTFPDGRTLRLDIPSGAFADPSTEISISEISGDACGTSNICLNGAVAAPCPELQMFSTSNRQPQLPVGLQFSYHTSVTNDELGPTFGSNKEYAVLARKTDAAECMPLQTGVSTAARLITSSLNHFGYTFQVVRPAESSALPEQKDIYPNPFYPNRGDGYVTFNKLPMSTSIRIYTLSGDKIWEGSKNSISPLIWNGKNQAGEMVASGIYLAVLDGAGSTKVLKVAVER